jgi:hypothetical protein
MESTGKFERLFLKMLQEEADGGGMTAGAGGVFGDGPTMHTVYGPNAAAQNISSGDTIEPGDAKIYKPLGKVQTRKGTAGGKKGKKRNKKKNKGVNFATGEENEEVVAEQNWLANPKAQKPSGFGSGFGGGGGGGRSPGYSRSYISPRRKPLGKVKPKATVPLNPASVKAPAPKPKATVPLNPASAKAPNAKKPGIFKRWVTDPTKKIIKDPKRLVYNPDAKPGAILKRTPSGGKTAAKLLKTPAAFVAADRAVDAIIPDGEKEIPSPTKSIKDVAGLAVDSIPSSNEEEKKDKDVHKPVKPGILKKRLGELSCSKVRGAKGKLKDKGTHYAKALQRYLNYHC